MIAPTLTSSDREALPVPGRFFDELPALACLIDKDGCLNRVNSAWLEVLGYSPQSVVGKPFTRFFHADDIPVIETGMVRCGPRETWDRFEARFRSQNGSYQWLLWQFKSDIERRFVYAVAFDLSDRRLEEAVSHRRLTAATLQSQVWAAITKGGSTGQAIQACAASVQRHLAAREVRIWVPAASEGKPVLQTRSIPPAAVGEPVAEFEVLDQYIRQVLASGSALVIPEVNLEPRLAPHQESFRERQIRGIALYPIAAQDQTVAVLGVFLSADCGASQCYLLDTVAREMGAAWLHLAVGEDLRATKRTYDALIRSTTVGISRLDAAGNVKAWNAAAEKILGWRSSEILARRFPVASANQRELFQTCLSGAFEGKSTARIETKCWSSSGKAVDVAVSISPLSDSEGVIRNAMLLFEDLTDRKRASRNLRLQDAIAGALKTTSNVDDALQSVLASMGGEFGWECGEFWQWSETEQLFHRIASWHSAEPHAAKFATESETRPPSTETAFLREILQGGVPRRFGACATDRSISRGGLAARTGLEQAFAFPVVDQDAAAVMLFFASEIEELNQEFLAVVSTISYQVNRFLNNRRLEELLREAEQDLLQAEKMDAIGRLVGGVVHDFNNLLTVILGYGELVIEDIGGDGSNRDLLLEVLNAGKRAAGLTKQLLAFCRKENTAPEVLDLNAVVTDMHKLLRRLVTEEIEIDEVLAPNLGRLRAVRGQIEQVIMNLVVNARDAMPEGGRILIETRAIASGDPLFKADFPEATPGNYALLAVTDAGRGMDEATKNRIFEPFFTTKPAGKGTGMGLATVTEIVKAASGQIAVESRLGKGTSVRILFPMVAEGLSTWQVDSAPPSVPRGSETVLVVDDDENVRRLIVRILKNQGYCVFEASGSPEAIEFCRTNSRPIDLLVADIVLPRINGLDLAAQLRKKRRDLKVLFVTGSSEEDVFSSASTAKIPILQKPFTSYDLASEVRELCDRK
jgi:PAS domain S-box-containing protein